ncbi:hypothetical protein BBP40_000789 [Aspergillus hancockii]|nr:hypothetical protein BBP40_000789 [Aspergillus hancockii]
MRSVTIPTPGPAALRRFCTENRVSPTALFKLGWALVLHSYFDTCAFQYDETHDASFAFLVSFVPELASKCRAVTTLQWDGMEEPNHEAILLHSSAKGFDSSLQKIWSRVRILSNGCGSVQDYVEINGHEDREFDIELVIQLHESQLSAALKYNTKLAETRDFNDVARALGQALESMLLTSNGQTIADIDLLSEHDAERIFRFNEQQPFVEEGCLHHLIEKSVSEHPDSVALLSWDGSLTYSALDDLSSRLAHNLIETFHIGPEKVVPLCFEKSIWAVVAMLAVLKTGAAYCCVDPAHPQVRRNYMVELVDASFVLCSPIHVTLIQNRPAIIVDAELVNGLENPQSSPRQTVKPENACVIAFTSGTTGNPKAIVHSHTSICSGLLANAPFQDVNRSSIRLFQWAAYTFDVSITETFSPLIYGGLVCIPSEEERLNNVDEAMIRMNVDWAYFTPSFARFFRRFTIPSLKQLILGGEAVTVDDVRDWVDKVPVLNAYGPAESITWFLEPQKGLSSTISIGRPINMRAWIASPEDPGRLMPIGAIGELLIEGPSLFREYIKNKEKTEQSLIEPPPWRLRASIGPGGKMYKTGDLVRYLPDGTMTYIGRKDTMVKLYGQRMELEEVETILRRNLPEAVQSSADVIRPAGENEEPVLVAFLCIAKGLAVPGVKDLQELKSYLQNKLTEALPAFMVPRIYIPVEAMPYNSSRKLDRARLRQSVTSLTRSQLIELLQSSESTSQGQDVSHDLTPMELTLQKLWVDALLLDTTQIGPDDNFFSLGASSITALNVTAAAKSKGINISYPDLFRTPTLRSLAQTVSYSSDQQKKDVTIPRFGLIEKTVRQAVISDALVQCQITEELIEDIYPLAPQQQGLWALSLIREGDYMAQFILTLNPEVDVDRFRVAWERTVELLPTLRTRFIESASGSYQVVLKGNIYWERDSNLEAYLRKDISLELAFGSPIVRHAIVSDEGPDLARHRIVWTSHHALFDGESVPLFLNAVARAYDGIPLEPQAGPFNKFIEYTGAVNEGAASTYWRSQFDSTNPVAYPALPNQTYRPNPSSVHRRQVNFKRLERSQITTATLLRAAMGLALVQAARSWDVTLGVTLAGRTAPVSNIEKVIGPTFVTLPTNVYSGVDDNVRDYLEHTQSSIIEMMPFEHTGMQNIATYSPQCEAACQFQTILLVQTPDDKSYTRLFTFDDSTGGFGRFNSHALMVLLFTNATGVDAVFSYDNQIIGDEHVSRLAHIFENFVHILSLEEPSRSLASFISVEPTRIPDTETVSRKAVEQTPDRLRKSTSNGTAMAQLTKMEASLAEAWTEVLRLPPQLHISAEDEFVKTFGGNSLLSLRLAQWCRDHDIRLTVKDIFQHPKLADMARVASWVHPTNQSISTTIPSFALMKHRRGLNSDHDSEVLSLRIEASTSFGVPVETIIDMYPATALQEGLLALSITQPGSYVSQTVFELVEDVDLDRFRDAWDQIYEEEEILRTRLFQPTSVPETVQVVLSNTLDWQFPTDLPKYLRENEESIGFGTPLSKFGIHRDGKRIYFVLTLHHALYDGWSFPLLLDKAYRIYSATGSTSTPHVAFNRFIHQVTSTTPSNTSDYWKSQFEGADFAHFPPPLLTTQKQGAQINVEYSTALPRAQHSGILTSTILRAGWALLLSTYTREEDVIFGATLSGRNVPLPGIEAVIGPTLTTLPIRVRVDKGVKTADFLRSVQDQSTGMIEYEHTGLQTIRQVAPEACNFQNLLILQPRGKKYDYSKLWTEKTGDISRFLTYPLVIQCTFDDNDDTMSVTVIFEESRIQQSQINRIIRQYENIILQLSTQDSMTLDQLDLFSAADMSELREWMTSSPEPQVLDRCLHDRILEQALQHSNDIAISSLFEGELTYKELCDYSTRLGRHLSSFAVKPGMTVPIVFDKSIWAPVAMVSVLISGAAFVPIDPEAPENRRDLVFDQVNSPIILTSREQVNSLNRDNVLAVDRSFFESLPELEGEDQVHSPSSPAYVIFTSGSTGVPKGVVVSHRAVCSSINAHGKAMAFSRHTRALQFGSYTFDVSIAEIFTTLVFGGTICVPSTAGRLNDLSNEIRQLRANWAFLTPSVARLLDPSEAPSLETLVLGGEEVRSSDVTPWSKKGTIRVMNGYGPTEACIFCATRVIDSPGSGGLIGSPIGCYGFVVDPDDAGKLAPIGTVGELIVSGPILADGYLDDDPPLTIISNSTIQKHILRLKEKLTGSLPIFAVPSSWLCVNRIPLTTSGKTDRRRAREWAANLSEDILTQANVAETNGLDVQVKPVGRMEEMIRDVWVSTLDIPADGLVSNRSFYNYGGDSVSAIRVVRDLRKRSFNITVKDLLLAKGVSDLARMAKSKEVQASTLTDVNDDKRETIPSVDFEKRLPSTFSADSTAVENILPCTPLQESMLKSSSGGFYNVEMIFEVHSIKSLDIARLNVAWYHVMERHSALRTIFASSTGRQGKHDQIVLKPFEPILFEVEDALSIRPSIHLQSAYQLDQPPHRLTLQRTSTGKIFLRLEISHAITDAVSLGIVFRDLELAYDGHLSTQPAPQFSWYLAQLWRQAEEDRAYWEQYCVGASPCLVPHLETDDDLTGDSILLHQSVPQQADASDILSFCRRSGVSVANLFHAIWALILKLHVPACNNEAIFGYLVSGRDMEIEGIENIVGPVISTAICRASLDDSTTLINLLTELRQDAVQSLGRKYCDLKSIEKALCLDRPLFNTLINFRKYSRPTRSEVDPSITFEYLEGFDPWEYDLTMVIDELDNGWHIDLAYLSARVEIDLAKKLAADFSSLLNFLVAHPEETVGTAISSLRR